MVLHTIKKVKGSFLNSKVPESSEFLDYKQRLENIGRALTSSSASVADSQKLWRKLAADHAKAAENYMNMYPDNDDVRSLAKKAHAASASVAGHFEKNEDAEAPSNAIDKHVKQFLTELKALDGEYKTLGKAKIEHDLYSSKVPSLENSKKVDEEKVERNKAKLEEARAKYEAMLQSTIARQKELYGKRHTIFQASFVSYWVAQGAYLSAMNTGFSDTVKYAREQQDVMATLDVDAIKPAVAAS